MPASVRERSISTQRFSYPRTILTLGMDSLPPELCLQVMCMIQSLPTLGNFILSQRYLFHIFTTYRPVVLRSVITNQFGSHAKEAIFLATSQVSGLTSERERADAMKRFHQFAWKSHPLDSSSLSKLSGVARVVGRLVSVFTSDLAAGLWTNAVQSPPPNSFPNAARRMRSTIYRYWILCEVFSNFAPSRRHFFWASSLERSTFDEFYRPLHMRDLLQMAFFEFCFFPRFMLDVCAECLRGRCDRM